MFPALPALGGEIGERIGPFDSRARFLAERVTL
jgi:hypothetical protein